MKGIIYCIHCISTGEKYIGQTRRTLKERLRHHKYVSKNSTRAKLYIQANKTGWNDFICGIVEEVDLEKLDEKECFYIEKYDTLNNGLNTAPGGGFFPTLSGKDHPLYGVGHTEETKRKISKNHHKVSGEKNPMYEKKQSEEQKRKTRERFLINHPSRNTFWWNDGETQVRSKERPSENFVKGRLSSFKKMPPSKHKGTFWWNNGETQIRSKDKPGDDFVKGRLNCSREKHPLYGVGHTEETKRKMSKNHSDVSGKNNPRSNHYKIEFIDGRIETVYCLTEWGRLNGYKKHCLFKLSKNAQKSPHKDILRITKNEN